MTNFFQRVRVSPGKHGHGDYRVTLDTTPPTHAELVMMLGAVLVAEDRYPVLGRYLLWSYVDQLLSAKTLEDVRDIAEAVQEETDSPTALKSRWVHNHRAKA